MCCGCVLAVVLPRVADVEDAAPDGLDRLVEHPGHGAGGVVDVDVGAPELLAETPRGRDPPTGRG